MANNRFVGLAATHVEAERKAQAYVANGETIKGQNAAVMKAEALTKEHQRCLVAPRRLSKIQKASAQTLLHPPEKDRNNP